MRPRPGGRWLAAARSSSHSVRSRPRAPAAGTWCSPVPDSAIVTARALSSPATTAQTSRAAWVVPKPSVIRVGGGLGELRTANAGRSS